MEHTVFLHPPPVRSTPNVGLQVQVVGETSRKVRSRRLPYVPAANRESRPVVVDSDYTTSCARLSAHRDALHVEPVQEPVLEI